MAECVEYLEKTKVLDYLIKRAEEAQADFDENGGESGIYAECLEDVIQDITNMPAADSKPETCYEWKYEFDDLGHLKGVCPVCRYEKRLDVHLYFGWKYCPECGSKMKPRNSISTDELNLIKKTSDDTQQEVASNV